MAESGGGGLGARFFSGLGALGNILRLSTGSQAVPAEGTIDDDDDELVSVDEEVAITKEILQQNDEIAPVNVDSVLSATQLTEEEYESVEYEGQLVTEMKNYELRSALKQEGVKVDARQTKKQCMDVLIKIAFTKVKNGTKSAAIENSENSSRALRSTPAKQLSKAAAGSSVSVNKMSTRRSAAASGPPSSNLRHRSPPHAPAATSPIVEKRKRATRTPSAKVEVNVASGKSDKRKSHISNDEYELSGTARKKLAVSAPTSAKKKSTPRTKQPPAEKKILPVSAKKPSPIRTSAVGLDEIAVNNAYGKSSRNREDSEEEEEEEEESMSDMEEADSVPGVHKVMSRADYVLSQSKAQAKRDSESKMNIEVTAVEVNIEQNLVQDMVVEEAEPALLENRSNRSYVTDNTYNIGSEDESFVDNDFPGAVPSRDEDGAEADAEDEEEEDEDEEDEEDKAIVPYDQVAEGDDEHENTAEEEEEEEEEDDNNNVSEEGDNEAAAPEVVDDEYEEEGGEEVHYEDEDENEAAAMSDDQSSEDAEQGGPNTSNPAYNRQQGAQIGVVDLVSSDDDDDNDNDNDNHEEKVEGTDDEDDGCGNDSFLTADTNDPAISKSSFTAKPHTQSHAHLQTIASIDKAVAATVAVAENPASIRSAVNTVLGALKGSLSTKDFHQLQQMMGKLPESSTIPPLPEPSATVNDIQLHRQASTSFSQAVDYSEAALPKNPAGRESRLSGDGRSWTSRESFLPPSPHDRFAPSVPSAGLSAAPTQSAESQKAMADVSLNYRGVSSVRFEDSERKISLGATNNHIRYGPVTFMRRPMTPFAKKPVSSPSPFTNPLYETSSAMPTQTQGSAVRQQLLTANLPFPSSEEQLRKRRYEDSNSTSNTDDREYSGAKRMNLGQARYSVGSYEQSRHDSTSIDDRNDMQVRSGALGGRFENDSQDEKAFSQGTYLPGSRASYSSYTPLYKDNTSRGVFSGVLLQGSQTQVRRGSLSFAQRRKHQRQSEGGQGAYTAPSAPLTGALRSSSAYASASVAKRILDTLGELQTPMEEARHRPIAVAAALSASADALSRSERAPLEPVRRPVPAATARAIDLPGPGPFNITFPVIPSVAQAAVAATTPSATAAASSVRSSSQWQNKSTANATPDAPPAKSPAPLFYFAPVAAPPAVPKTPRTPMVRFAEPDSEFTFVDPSEVDGVDQSEMEQLLATPGKRDERIKFTFSPPGKANKSSEKSRRSLGVTESRPKGSLDASSLSTPTGSNNQTAPQGESLWSKAIATASNTQKCPTCFVQNSKAATSCVSCETALKGAGQATASASAPVPVQKEPTAPMVGFSFAPVTPVSVPAAVPAPVAVPAAATTEPVKGSLWAMAASSDLVKCQTCLVQNPKGSVKCLSCENSLVSSAGVPAPKAAFAVPPPSSSSAPFTFGAPAATVTSTVATQPAVATTFRTSAADPAPAVKPAAFSFGATSAPAATIVMPSAAASFTGFTSIPAPVPNTAVAPILFPAALSTATAPSSSGAGTFGSHSASDESKKSVSFTFGLPSSSSVPATTAVTASSPAPFSFGAVPSTTTPSATTPSASFGGFGAGLLPPTTSTPTVAASTAAAPFAFGSVSSAAVTTPSSSLSLPAFTFGAPAPAPGASTTPAPFVFGAAGPAASKPEAAAGFAMAPFSFGNTAPAPTPVPAGALSAPAFSFGASTAPAPFMFGAASTTTPTPTPSFPSNPVALGGASFGMDSPTSTMDTGYTSGDASNIAFPPATMPTAFGVPPAPFTFGASAPSIGAMGSQLAPFGTSSQPFNNSVTSFGLPSGNQPFAFSAQPQAQTQPPFGFGPGIASGSGYTQSQQAPFTFGQPPAGGFSSAPQGMGMGMGHSMIDPVGGGGGGGFSMGAADPKGRRKVKAKRPGGGP